VFEIFGLEILISLWTEYEEALAYLGASIFQYLIVYVTAHCYW
jgi:hypothetical protein